MRVFRFVFLFLIFCAQAAFAQQNPVKKGEKLEITADGSLEWHRNEKFFRATKNVRAQQGATTLLSALLTAHYTETKDEDMSIQQIEAEGGVVIESAQSKAYGERAVYDLNKGLATMTGKGLKLVTEQHTVTARERFEYWANEGRLKAIGRAVAVQGEDRIEADTLSAVFVQNKEGKRVLKTLEAQGNVKITTPTEVLTGDYGIYKAETNTAEVKGNVKIVRGPNTLEGDRAQVDLNTNVSSMFGGEGTGRVKAVFFPGSEKKPE